METIEKILNIIGEILLAIIILWILGVKIFFKIWKKLTSLGE